MRIVSVPWFSWLIELESTKPPAASAMPVASSNAVPKPPLGTTSVIVPSRMILERSSVRAGWSTLSHRTHPTPDWSEL